MGSYLKASALMSCFENQAQTSIIKLADRSVKHRVEDERTRKVFQDVRASIRKRSRPLAIVERMHRTSGLVRFVQQEENSSNKRGWMRANYFYRQPEKVVRLAQRRTPASGAEVVRLRNNTGRTVIVAPRLTARCTAILANICIVRGASDVAFKYRRTRTID